MISDSTFGRLRWHADLDEVSTREIPSLSSCALPGAVDTPKLERALSDFVRTLEALNHELNGQVPSERIATEMPMLPAALVYAVTEVIRLLRERQVNAVDEIERRTVGRAAWRAETAWSAVLAGDIDDIQAHVDEEEAARFD